MMAMDKGSLVMPRPSELISAAGWSYGWSRNSLRNCKDKGQCYRPWWKKEEKKAAVPTIDSEEILHSNPSILCTIAQRLIAADQLWRTVWAMLCHEAFYSSPELKEPQHRQASRQQEGSGPETLKRLPRILAPNILFLSKGQRHSHISKSQRLPNKNNSLVLGEETT